MHACLRPLLRRAPFQDASWPVFLSHGLRSPRRWSLGGMNGQSDTRTGGVYVCVYRHCASRLLSPGERCFQKEVR